MHLSNFQQKNAVVRAGSALVNRGQATAFAGGKSGRAAGLSGHVVILPERLSNLACLVDVPLHAIDNERILV